MIRRATTVLASALVVGCGAGAARHGGVRIATNVPSATLYVDDELRGPVREYEDSFLDLEPGRHVLRLEQDEYAPTEVEVLVAEGVGATITLELRRRAR